MKNPWAIAVLVGVGGFAGTLARYGLSLAFRRFSFEWPLGTWTANVLGCLLIGSITGLSARVETISPEVRLVLATGFCGGFTTLSSLIYETSEMLRASEHWHATLYVVGSFTASMTAFVLGLVAVRMLIKPGGGLWS